MKEFSNLFTIYPVSDIQRIENNRVILKAGCSGIRIDSDDFSFEPDGQTGEAGKLYAIESTVVIDKVSPLTARRFAIDRSVVVEAHCAHTNEAYLIGSMEYPARVSITSYLNKDRLKISLKSLQSPL